MPAIPPETTAILIAPVVGIVVFAVIITMIRTMIQVCPPHNILVVQGPRTHFDGHTFGFRIVRGGWALVIPFLHRAELLDLSIRTIRLRVDNVTSANGITLSAEMTAAVCVHADDEKLIYSAVERLLGRSADEITEQIQDTMTGNFRGALSQATPLEVVGMSRSVDISVEKAGKEAAKSVLDANETFDETSDGYEDGDGERAAFRTNLMHHLNSDLAAFGMRLASVSVMRISDTSGYLANLASRSVAIKARETEIQENQLQTWADSEESGAERRANVAQNTAEERISIAQKGVGLAEQDRDAKVDQARQEAEAQVSKTRNIALTAVANAQSELQEQRNYTEVICQAETDLKATEIIAEGQSEAWSIKQGAENDIIQAQANMLKSCPTTGPAVLFVEEHLEEILNAYIDNASDIGFESLVGLDNCNPDDIVNRGPRAIRAFLHTLDDTFGIDLREVFAPNTKAEDKTEDKRVPA